MKSKRNSKQKVRRQKRKNARSVKSHAELSRTQPLYWMKKWTERP